MSGVADPAMSEMDDPEDCQVHVQSSVSWYSRRSLPKRFVFSCVGFLASTLAISLNTNLSMAIVSMVDRSNATLLLNDTSAAECRADVARHQEDVSSVEGEFDWSPETEGWALGAVYWGQMVGFVPGGRAAEIWGGKRTMLAFLLVASVSTLATPLAARISVYAFVACRFIVGVGTAPVIPVLFHLISRWIPEQERSFNASFILAGYGVGSFLSFLTSGWMCSHPALGWTAVFYTGGACGVGWCALCCLLVYDTPGDHPTIGEEELSFISQRLGRVQQKQIRRIPWRALLTSAPFLSLALGYFGQFWILGFYSTVHTLYMGTVLHLDSATNGELSCLPPLARGLFACLCGYPADWALRKGRASKEQVRKGATLVNSVLSCSGFVAVLLAGCDPLLNTLFFTAGGLTADFITFGVCMAAVDIAPNLSGTVSGILSLVGVVPFFAIPALVGFYTQHERSMAQWRYVYYGTIGVVFVTTVVFLLFGTSDAQPWGTDDENIEDDGLASQQQEKAKRQIF